MSNSILGKNLTSFFTWWASQKWKKNENKMQGSIVGGDSQAEAQFFGDALARLL